MAAIGFRRAAQAERDVFLRFLFGFGGRMDRSNFWRGVVYLTLLWVAVGLALMMAVGLVLLGLGLTLGPDKASFGFSTGPLGLALSADKTSFSFSGGNLWLLSLIPLGQRRLHDRGKSGWWLLAFFGLPVALGYVSDLEPTNTAAFASLGVALWAFVELGFLRGTRGPNRYGPDPHAQPAAARD